MRQATNTIKKENFLFHPSASSVRMDGEEKKIPFFYFTRYTQPKNGGKCLVELISPFRMDIFFPCLLGCVGWVENPPSGRKNIFTFSFSFMHMKAFSELFFLQPFQPYIFCFHSLLTIRKYESSSWKCSFSCGSEYIQTEKSVAA